VNIIKFTYGEGLRFLTTSMALVDSVNQLIICY